MNAQTLEKYANELYQALRTRTTVAPLTERESGITIEDAYQISKLMFERRLAEGEVLIGKKIGVTSHVVQNMLSVHQPDFGYLTDRMVYEEVMPISQEMIQPRAEGEIAFLLKDELRGPNVTAEDVLDATECVMACFEIVDSRVDDWKIKIEDTVADNASSGLFVLGKERICPRDLDLSQCQMKVYKNGSLLSQGRGDASSLGSPEACVAWLANTMGAFGVALQAGEVILSGSLVPLEPVVAGDDMICEIEGMGRATIRFT